MFTDESRGTSYPSNKALIMPCRGEISKRIYCAFAVTERKENRTLREKSREWERALCLTGLEICLLVRQSRQLIIAERGAPPKARLSSPLSCFGQKSTKSCATFRKVDFVILYKQYKSKRYLHKNKRKGKNY